MKFKNAWIISSLLFLVLMSLIALQPGKWDRYYKNKQDQPPRQVVVKALSLFERPAKALDIGFGAGNETVLMLNSGWQVWAIDTEPKAVQIINQRRDVKDLANLAAAVANFEENSTWDILPQVDFINASYALPFCNPHKFETIWTHIKQKLNTGGRFAGHFFGLNYRGFTEKEMKQMTFLSKEEVLNLLQDFDIESFQEVEEDGKSGTGKTIHSHVFEVIVQKNNKVKRLM
jgi:tellurite methyltransferase